MTNRYLDMYFQQKRNILQQNFENTNIAVLQKNLLKEEMLLRQAFAELKREITEEILLSADSKEAARKIKAICDALDALAGESQ